VAEVAGDVFAETGLGPALCVAGTLYIGYVLTNGYATIKRLKEELTAEGYDVEEFNKVGELKAIRRAVDDGTVDGIFDKVWYQRAVMSVGSGSIVDVQKTQAYWKKRGVNVKTLADLDKITAYMVKKYGKDAKMSG
jgi:glycerol dehydrogenase-like iron-containing ADH family enzyme